LAAGEAVRTRRDEGEERARLTGEVVTSDQMAPRRQGGPFLLPAAREDGRGRHAVVRSDVHEAAVDGQHFARPADERADRVEAALEDLGRALEPPAQTGRAPPRPGRPDQRGRDLPLRGGGPQEGGVTPPLPLDEPEPVLFRQLAGLRLETA